MKRTYSFSLILLPLVMLLVLAGTLLIQRTGISYVVSARYAPLQILKPENVDIANFFPKKPTDTLLLENGDESSTDSVKLVNNVKATLNSMRVKYDSLDVNTGKEFDITKYHIIVITFQNLDKISAKIPEIMDWNSKGGRILFSIHPAPTDTFMSIYHNVGIVSTDRNLVRGQGVEFVTDLLPGAKGLKLGLNHINNTSYPVKLSEDARVHLISADSAKTPLLWEYDNGKGRVVFINTDQFSAKTDRGIISASYSLLDDVFVYPVINASVFFIDDFPSPIREGSSDLIAKQYGMDMNNFYTNVWWPDLVAISRKYDFRFTTGMIETYSDVVTPPLESQLDTERSKYFGASNISEGGEIGLHGYNHVPLCNVDTDVNKIEGYPAWPSTEAMQLSINELYTFGNSLFPKYKFTTYVPPSNILCSDSRKWLPMVLPDLKIISSVYYKADAARQYEQEFTEASDGIIELPRIISGYDIDDFMKWAAINELGFHFVNTHFVHPDDVLDIARGAQKGWAYLRNTFEDYVKWLKGAAPGLRPMTANEGGMAVQRYARLAMETNYNNGNLEISFGNFYDEAWLMMRTNKKPTSLDGAVITQVTSDLYLVKATKSKITISFGE